MSLLLEARQRKEKVVYEWRLDDSRVADVVAGRKIIPDLPPHTGAVAFDGAYDAYDVYEAVENQGAKPYIRPRANARTQTRNARGRAIRNHHEHPVPWKRVYHRRPITESANWSLKRRWGDRLWRHGLWRQRNEVAFRILAYNCNMVNRAWIRFELQGIPRREL